MIWIFHPRPETKKKRRELYSLAEEKGCEYLHKLLEEKDSDAAARIHPHNIKKVVRAIEAAESGAKIPSFEQSFVKTKDYDAVIIGLERDRSELYERIDKRVNILIDAGLEDEVRGLIDMGSRKTIFR